MDNTESSNNELQLVREFQSIYSPTTILGVYANAIKTPADNKIILAKGEYHASLNAREYGGYYYDDLKSTYDNRFLKIKTLEFLYCLTIYSFPTFLSRVFMNSRKFIIVDSVKSSKVIFLLNFISSSKVYL